MSRKSSKDSPAGKTVRVRASELPTRTPAERERLRAAMSGPVDTSDIPERTARGVRVERDTEGRIIRKGRTSPIRSAVLEELARRDMTRYELWRKARAECPTLPQSAVYEFLRGEREIGLPYVEAIMTAAGLAVGPAAGMTKPSGTKSRAK